MQPMADEKGISVAQLALAWLLHQPAVTTVIIGAKKTEQLEDNLKAIDVQLTSEDLDTLNEVSKLQPEYPGWMLERQGQDRQA
jgi:aryl-alcohol dehydrogenase-like predicted oxidoreductase